MKAKQTIKELGLYFLHNTNHGYLRVENNTTFKENQTELLQDISKYSFKDNKHYYFEEDCDTGRFLNNLSKLTGITIAEMSTDFDGEYSDEVYTKVKTMERIGA